ncbi:hypothetical protein C8J56DRAFT_931366 [Mycena floridula]|nr:hypothetical protein C8J56DRAFT_931366 [Mycena floridula]
MNLQFLSYPRPYAPPGEALPFTRETLTYVFLTQTVPLFAILFPPMTSILIQTSQPSITSTASFLIDLGLTMAALGTTLASARTGAFSSQFVHSFCLVIVLARPAFEILPVLETEKMVLPEALILAFVVILFIFKLAVLCTVTGLVVNWIHRRWGCMDNWNDWNPAFQVMMSMKLTKLLSPSLKPDEMLLSVKSAPIAGQTDDKDLAGVMV